MPCCFPWLGREEKGENHCQENLPNTAWIDFHRDFFVQRASSFFSDSMPVSSFQMAETWVPNMMEVNNAKRRPSKRRKRIKTTVAGGEKTVQVFQSPWMQVMKWLMP